MCWFWALEGRGGRGGYAVKCKLANRIKRPENFTAYRNRPISPAEEKRSPDEITDLPREINDFLGDGNDLRWEISKNPNLPYKRLQTSS